jgi:molecular chaperone GrpE (heat shock protein)
MVRDADPTPPRTRASAKRRTSATASSLIYSTEKSLKEVGDKLDAGAKATSRRARELKRVSENGTAAEVKAATDKLQQASYKMAEALYQAILASEGVKPIDVKGKPFDPRIAEAIGTLPAPSDVPDDTVLEVAEKGYTIGEELLRPAKVLVAKH